MFWFGENNILSYRSICIFFQHGNWKRVFANTYTEFIALETATAKLSLGTNKPGHRDILDKIWTISHTYTGHYHFQGKIDLQKFSVGIQSKEL